MAQFTCECCAKTFQKIWSDEEALKEFEQAPWNIANNERALICDDCFTEFKTWLDSLSPEQRAAIRRKYH